jgi:methyl-accepting chemotaxis protein
MTIAKRLYTRFGLILGIVGLIATVNVTALLHERSTRSATQASIDMSQAVAAIRYEMMDNQLHLRSYLLSGMPSDEKELASGMETERQLLSKAEQAALTPEQSALLSKLRTANSDFETNMAHPLLDKRKQVDSGNSTVAELEVFYLNMHPAEKVKEATELTTQIEEINNKLVDERRKQDEAASNGTLGFTIVGFMVTVGLGAFISFKTAKSITDPLGKLMKVARDIGETGELEHNIDVDRTDEIGELARTFQKMVGYLKEMSGASEAIATGDLTQQVMTRSEHDTLGHAFASMTEGLTSLVRTVRDGASQVASGAGQVANASEESAKISVQSASAIDEVTSTMHEMSINVQNMVKSTQVQASSVSETSASIDEMVASIQRVADTAKVLLDISNRSRQEVQGGISSMEKATNGLNRITDSIRSSAEIIDVLGHRADDIGKIVEVIDDLAEQTNLLALNAAIEAARAGEHGLGFAVVADEVRKLAEKSAQSTKEISDLIASIQKEARKAVDNMDKSTTIVNEGLALGGDLSTALKKISNVVTEVYKFAQEIGAATNEQSHGSSQIAKATTRLNEITHEISSSVEEQASGTQAVVNAMERMRELVQQSTSSSTELAASSEQMSKMSRQLLEAMGTFQLQETSQRSSKPSPSKARAMAARA